ncbi:hypothetical protein ACFOQM_22480 [Paenibacillus sp. GCM10012307]|uniref:DUF4306 domain-containing protein n=1 Tax=Paenibacillus roseus TaxID=2798579 RepID=A0A934JBH1_9BACL|nr:hypothetical protein [Paenibacillus roseus]MBJ6363997.1 hypothetical protein [Paenibacillus roseus]
MSRKLVAISILLLAYFLLCWVVDLTSSTIVMNASGRPYHIEYHFFYNKYLFYSDPNVTSNIEMNIKLDRIFILGAGSIFLVLYIFKKFKRNNGST